MNPSVILIIFAIVSVGFFLGYFNEKKRVEEIIQNILNSYGKANTRKYSTQELENIGSYFKNHPSDFYIDDITWNDLDMWTVYKKINYCLTNSGDEYLYYTLKTPRQNLDKIDEFENVVWRLMKNNKEREAIVRALYEIGRDLKGNFYKAVEGYDKQNNILDYIIDLGYVISILVCFVNVFAGIIGLVFCAVFAVLTYFGKKRKTQKYMSCIDYVLRLINGSDKIVECNLTDFKLIDELACEIKKLKRIKNKTWLVMGAKGDNPISILGDYIRMLTHIDLIFFNSIMKEMKASRDIIDKTIGMIGRLDMYVSVAYYRSSLEEYCVPEFDNELGSIIAKDVYHPLLNNPVKNNYDSKKSVIITGSNASGKSTFLKTIALNTLLAQTINTVCASAYKAPLYRLYTALRMKDSIANSESYYMAEIRSIKRIMDSASTYGNTVLTMVDEILKGTNTTERIAAGASILKKMNELGIYVMAATHDLELAYLLDSIYNNYHFKEEMTDKDVSFTYVIYEGVAKSRNAIKLLKIMGYDDDISDLAEVLARRREKEGAWIL